MRQVVLLRGINIGPHKRIAMPELRAALTRAGYKDVHTHLQSGNVVLSSDAEPDELAREVETLITKEFALDVPVVARTREELADVVERDPIEHAASDPKHYQVSFLSAELDAVVAGKLEELAAPHEQLVVIGREIYAWHPATIARSKLWAALAGPRLGVAATARNWTTVTKLLELASSR
jgi:uncharacterized protein (DUF1697 family)